jgi:hypothetical protein
LLAKLGASLFPSLGELLKEVILPTLAAARNQEPVVVKSDLAIKSFH